MTEIGSTRTARKAPAKGARGRTGIFAALGLFVRQILDELRKVVRPTRSELGNYTLVVIVFVMAMMALVSALDFGFGRLVRFALGG